MPPVLCCCDWLVAVLGHQVETNPKIFLDALACWFKKSLLASKGYKPRGSMGIFLSIASPFSPAFISLLPLFLSTHHQSGTTMTMPRRVHLVFSWRRQDQACQSHCMVMAEEAAVACLPPLPCRLLLPLSLPWAVAACLQS